MTQPLAIVVTNTDPNSCVTVRCDRIGKPWHLTTRGATFIAVLESGMLNGTFQGKPVVDGFIVKVYDDGFGIPTVGLGHRVVPEDHLALGDIISVERARNFFDVNLRPVEAAINRDVRVPLYQYEYDALVSVLFNAGTGKRDSDPWPGTRSQYLASYLNQGEYDRMRDVIRTFVAHRVPGRRRTEAQLFETGNYDASH
ncbi:lysozyme [Paraburkholderia caffeinilytica]|uniref:lysozyme n=1 Tax=Paraburkholderia caffeinilytica TaxID=1761016 RepID=UPI0038BBBED8